jgi:hypothetical protein
MTNILPISLIVVIFITYPPFALPQTDRRHSARRQDQAQPGGNRRQHLRKKQGKKLLAVPHTLKLANL